jgi:hypothetical protein
MHACVWNIFAILFQREERLIQREKELEQQYVAKVRNNCLLDLARDQRLDRLL